MPKFKTRIEYVFDYVIEADNEQEVRDMVNEGVHTDSQVIDVYDGPIIHAVYEV